MVTLSLVALLVAQTPLRALKSTDQAIGHGKPAAVGDMVYVDYTGKLKSGTVFDSSTKPGRGPFSFTLGNSEVIKGWDQGVVGMRIGGKRHLSIPYRLAYGDRPVGTIPAKSDLYFDIKLLDVIRKGHENDVRIIEQKKGHGRAARSGDTVSIHYVGHLVNGAKFDSSRDRKQPFSFTIGSGQVIPGFDKGVTGMKVGGKRRVTVPPALGYGAQAQPGLPSNSILIFDLELLGIR